MNEVSATCLYRPSFSVVTAVYNGRQVIDRTIQSLRGQQFRDFEWVIIDGGSTDGTLEKLQEARNDIAFMLSEPDQGIADAWNKGIQASSGSYIMILNAGDTYDSDCLAAFAEHLDGFRIVCSDARRIDVDGHDAGLFHAHPEKLFRGMHLPHNWAAVPRGVYQRLGPYSNRRLAMDFEWFHRYYLTTGIDGFRVIGRPLGSYYLGGVSDINYIESFKANEEVLRSHGTHAVLARTYRTGYTLKHALKCRLIPQLQFWRR